MPIEIGSGTNTATNRVEVLDSDSGTAPTIHSVGPDANVDLALDGQGTGTVLVNGSEVVNVADAQVLHDKTLVTAILTNPKISSIHDANDNTGLEIAAVPSAVNHLAIANAAPGSGPYLFSTGPDANIGIGLFPAGTGAVILGTGGGQTILAVGHTGSVANAFGITAGPAGSGPTLAAFGSDTDVDFNILTQGAGHLKVNGAIIDTTSTHALASKATPVDTDEIPLVDSAASFGLKKLTWVNLKATLATWLTDLTATWTNKTLTAPSINYITDANGYPIFNMIPGAGAIANYLATLNSSTGQPVVLAAVGADTNIDLNVAGQGSGAVNVIGDLNVYASSSTVSTVSATGVNPNLDLNLASKNSGVVKINGVPAADRAYVDATVQGLQVKPTADVVATSALPTGTYSNGTAGVGATFTATATGTTTVDGHVLAATELVLLTAQASAFQNGLYTVTTAGATGVATVLTRHTDMDTATEFAGAFVPVGNKGTVNLNSLWLANPSGAVTVGTTAIPFTQLNGATDLVQGNAISIIGNTIAVSGTTAEFNTALTDDDFVTLTNTVNLLNKTLANPKINTILDANGNIILDMVHATGAQNWIRIFNEPTGVGAVIEAVGFDTNVDLNLIGQGTGKVKAWDGSVFQEVANTTELATGVAAAENRANHTGTQAASTISDFATTVDAEVPVVMHASSAKATPVDADEFPVLDSATSFSLKKYTLANLKTVLAAWIATLTAVWTNKTLTAPVLQHPAVDYVTDTNGAPALLFSAVPSAVNYVDILNNATGAGPYIAGVGSDANVDLNLIGQGTGKPKIGGAPIATTTDVATGVTTAEARANHTGTQSADTIVDGTTNKVLTATDKTRLATTSGTNTGDQTSVSGNAGTATKLATARNINGVAFDGTAAITVADSTKQFLYLVTALKTADYLSVGNEFVPMDTTSGSKTITFPTAPADGTQVGAKMVVQVGTNTVSFACGGSDHINTTTGLTSAVALTKLNQAINYKYNAASAVWYVTSTDVPANLLEYVVNKDVASGYAGLNGSSQLTHDTTGNAATATKFAATKNINGVAFDGSADITVADATKVATSAINVDAAAAFHVARVATQATNSFTIVSGTVTAITGLVIDTITCAVADKILIKDAPASTGVGSSSSTQPGNGLYTVTSVAGGNLAVSRATEFGTNIIGHMIRITEGTQYGASSASSGGRIYMVQQPITAPVTYGTTPINLGGDFIVPWSVALGLMGSQRGSRATTTASTAAPTINVDTFDAYRQTAMSTALTGITISGTPFEGHVLELGFRDNGTARALTRGGTFISGLAPMASTTIVGSSIRERYVYNFASNVYECFESVVIGAGRVKLTEYTCSSTTTDTTVVSTAIPAGAVGVRVSITPGGAGGGSGRRGAAGTIRGGGGGGACQQNIVNHYLPIGSATFYTATIGHVGVGGAAQTVDSTDGNVATAMAACLFTLTGGPTVATSATSLTTGFSGTSAVGGASGNAVIRDVNQNNVGNFTSGAAGGGSTPLPTFDGMDSWGVLFPSGAGGGGGISAADVAGNGSNGGRQRSYSGGQTVAAGGVVDTTLPATPSSANTSGLPGQGGGGGAASKTAAAQAGADGVGYGAPGGGGGASLNGFNSGRGGNGGPAYMRLEWVYA